MIYGLTQSSSQPSLSKPQVAIFFSFQYINSWERDYSCNRDGESTLSLAISCLPNSRQKSKFQIYHPINCRTSNIEYLIKWEVFKWRSTNNCTPRNVLLLCLCSFWIRATSLYFLLQFATCMMCFSAEWSIAGVIALLKGAHGTGPHTHSYCFQLAIWQNCTYPL